MSCFILCLCASVWFVRIVHSSNSIKIIVVYKFCLCL
nr:MAG TPA: hypothetical protein [Caudoviricetes sp.]